MGKKLRKILYPGTFDPIHNGHIDIASRAAELFDELEFVVAVNPEKDTLFSLRKRVELIKPLQDKINNAINKLAKSNNYQVIFDSSSDIIMLYKNTNLDKSDEILKLMGY